MKRFVLAALGFLTVLGASGAANAYCRTYSCDPNSGACPKSQSDPACFAGGVPLFWPVPCVGFSLNQDGSKTQNISVEALARVADVAFSQWQNADCGGGKHPSIQLSDLGAVVCDKHEYNQDQGNANLIVFRDQVWPYEGTANTLALTTLTFNIDNGQIYDADMEINGVPPLHVVTSEPTDGEDIDLQSVITHEAGHFLGLAHSPDPDATMYATYIPGSITLRDLDADDVAAICATYPPNQPATGACDPTPRHGYSTECAVPTEPESTCAVGAVGRAGQSIAGLGLVALVGLAARRRRARA